MSKAFLFVLAAIVVIVLAVGIPNFSRARQTHAANPCLNTLRMIDSWKQEWALERSKTTNDTPTWDDIRPYFPARWSNSLPACPDGGVYTLGRVGQPPTCSLGDKEPGHKEP